MQREISARPVVEPIVAERAAGRIEQMIVRLPQQIEEIAEQRGRHKAARHGDDGVRDGGRSHAAMKRRRGYNSVKSAAAIAVAGSQILSTCGLIPALTAKL